MTERSVAQKRFDQLADRCRGHRVRFDYHLTSTVAVCQCGWRDLATTRDGARGVAADHLQRAIWLGWRRP
jgi:hypothetical protein